MKVRMMQTLPVSPDGIGVTLYKRGEKYDVPDNVGQMMLDGGSAEQDKDMGDMLEAKDWDAPLPVTGAEKPKRKRRKKR